MERTQAQVILPRLFQLHVAPDDVDDVDAREQVLDEALGNHRSVVKVYASAMPMPRTFAIDHISRCLTNADALPMSARPAIRDLSSAMALPIACGPLAPDSASATSMAADNSASDICGGR